MSCSRRSLEMVFRNKYSPGTIGCSNMDRASKTEYMECGPRIKDGVDGTELNKVNSFKFLGSKVASQSTLVRKVEHVLMQPG
ncbi:hypothetical protein RB195_023835 [Necator americanus]